MSERETRQSPWFPFLLPAGILVAIGLVLFGFSRILLHVSATAATVVACIVASSVLGIAAFVASRRQVGGSSVLSLVGAVGGVAMLAGGLALVAAPVGGGEAEAQAATLVAGPKASTEGYATDKLAVASDQPIDLEFDNEEPGVQHNVVIFDGEDEQAPQLFSGSLVTGVNHATYSVPALSEGAYFFHCEVHPTTMTGEIKAAPGPEGGGGGGGPTVVAQNLAFDTSEIDLPADQPTTIHFDNQDPGQSHNIAIFADDSLADELFKGDLVTGPGSADYPVPPLKAGEYFFHCDVHPTMNGTVVVAGGPGGEGGGPGGGSGPGGASGAAGGGGDGSGGNGGG
jgi:plastocyanin